MCDYLFAFPRHGCYQCCNVVVCIYALFLCNICGGWSRSEAGVDAGAHFYPDSQKSGDLGGQCSTLRLFYSGLNAVHCPARKNSLYWSIVCINVIAYPHFTEMLFWCRLQKIRGNPCTFIDPLNKLFLKSYQYSTL